MQLAERLCVLGAIVQLECGFGAGCGRDWVTRCSMWWFLQANELPALRPRFQAAIAQLAEHLLR